MLKQGIKQIRLNDSQVIRTRLTEFVGKNINLVFHDGKTITGKLDGIDQDIVTLLNMRLKPMRFTFQQIAEVYFDVIV